MKSLVWGKNIRVFLAVILVIAAVLSFTKIGEKSMWLDEAFSVGMADLGWGKLFENISQREANQSLYYILLKLWLPLGYNESAIRSLSAIFALASVLVIFAIGSRLFNERAGLIAALLLSVNAFFIEYAQEARGYSLVLLLVSVSTFFMIKVVEDPSWKNKVIYVIVSGISVYAHFFALFVLMAQGFSLFFLSRNHVKLKDIGFCVLGTFAFLAPLFVFLYFSVSNQSKWIPKPHLKDIYFLFMALTGNGGRALLLAYFIPGMLFLFHGIRSWNVSKRHVESWRYVLILCWLLIPIAVSYAISLFKPIFVIKYLLVSLPALVLIAGVAIEKIEFQYVKVLFIILVLMFSVREVRSYYPKGKENWRESTRFVVENARDGDSVLFYAPYVKVPFEFYRKRFNVPDNVLHCIYPSPLGEDMEDTFLEFSPDDLNLIGPDLERIWLVLAHHDLTNVNKHGRLILNHMNKEFVVKKHEEYGRIKVLLYGSKKGS